MMNNMFFESKSKYAFDETVEKLSNIIVEAGWRVTHTHDLKETMRKNGFDVLPAKVIELCNPGYAYRILSADELRIYGNMMPCRISVHEKADGKTYVTNELGPVCFADWWSTGRSYERCVSRCRRLCGANCRMKKTGVLITSAPV